MNPEHLQAVCEAFSLGRPLSLEEDHEGVLNQNFDLSTDTGRYFLKIVRDRRKDSVPYIAAIESFMAEGGIPAVCMRETKAGDKFLSLGEDIYTVYPFIEHARILEPDYQHVGEMLALIHKRGDESRPSILESSVLTEKPLERVRQRLEQYRLRAAQDGSVYADSFRRYIDAKLNRLDSLPQDTSAARTLVHGDYHARNLLFSSDRRIIGICDWEKAELAPRAYEVIRSLHYICFQGREAPYRYVMEDGLAKSRLFMEGYRHVYPLTSDEFQAGYALRLRKLVMSFWIEERFYDHADDRANQFIEHERELIEDFSDGAVRARLQAEVVL